MKTSFNFKNKVVCVTGAGRGIGRDIAAYFGALGAKVILISRTEAQLLETAKIVREAGGEALVVPADLSKVSGVKAAVQKIKTLVPTIDVLINDAATAIRKPSEDLTEEEWDIVLNINLKAVFFMTTEIAREFMIPKKQGKIVSIASIGGILGITNSAPYSASKGGVVLVTKVLGCEWAKYNIQVNAVGPAYINTELIAKAIENKDFLNAIIDRTPARRLGEPDDVVGAVLYLASDLADFVTGTTLMVDGGLTALCISEESTLHR